MSKEDVEEPTGNFCFRIEPFTRLRDEEIARVIELGTGNDNLFNPNEFTVVYSLSDDFLIALYCTFQKFVLRQLQWKSLEIFMWKAAAFEPKFLQDALRVANEASLFENMDLDIMWHESYNEAAMSDPLLLLPSLEQNHRLKSLKLRSTASNFPPADIQSLCRTIEETTTLTDLTITFSNEDHSAVFESLALNKTLKTIDMSNVQHQNAALKISQALAGHKKLRRLSLHCISGTESDFEQGIHLLLTSKTCRLAYLFMKYAGPERLKLNTDRLLEALKDNISLQKLDMNFGFSGERPLSKLLSAVQSHPRLKSILFKQSLEVEDDIQAATDMETLPRRVFIVSIPYIHEAIKTAMGKFLDCHPEVSLRYCLSLPKELEYANHLNESGRNLMNLEGIPVGLWALVLERINKRVYNRRRTVEESLEEYKPSVLFDFLHGPALAARETQTGVITN